MFARTDRLVLRPAWPEDARDVFEAIADEALVRNLARAPWPYRMEDARDFVSRPPDPRLPSLLVFQRTGGTPRLVGACGLSTHRGGAELGYWIRRSHWGLGYATEAARAVLAMAEAAGHSRLQASHFEDNPASGNVLKKIGFRPTGRVVLRDSAARPVESRSHIYEWEAGAAAGADDEEGEGSMTDAARFVYDAIAA